MKIKLVDNKVYNLYIKDALRPTTQPQRFCEYKGLLLGVDSSGKNVAYSLNNGVDWYIPRIDRYNNRERIDIINAGQRIRLFVHRLVLFLFGSNSEGFVTYKNGNKYSFHKVQPQTIPLDWKSNKENVIVHLDGNSLNNNSNNLTVLKLTPENVYSTQKNWVTSSWLESIQKVGKDLIVEFKNSSKKNGDVIVTINYPNKGVFFKSLFNAPSKGKWIWQNLMPNPIGHNNNYKILGYRRP